MSVILTISDAFRFDDKEGLEGMNDFLKNFPMFRRFLETLEVS
jgi:hypothetical protein